MVSLLTGSVVTTVFQAMQAHQYTVVAGCVPLCGAIIFSPGSAYTFCNDLIISITVVSVGFDEMLLFGSFERRFTWSKGHSKSHHSGCSWS